MSIIKQFFQTPKNQVKIRWISFLVLIFALSITVIASYYTYSSIEKQANIEFRSVCNELKLKITGRLQTHAQLLRSSAAHFIASDSINRTDWQEFVKYSKIDKNLPGIQGIGFSKIIKKTELQEHIKRIRSENTSDTSILNYHIRPTYDRDTYTSIIFLEPFDFRNRRAFGYDMFSEPVRRKAMTRSRDFDLAAISGKVLLVQETGKDPQAGTLMYVPVYSKKKAHSTINERRKAILGWVYSPFRMNNLMAGILGRWDSISTTRIHLEIYDNYSTSSNSILFDSQSGLGNNKINTSLRTIIQAIDFNGKIWTLKFEQANNLNFQNYSKILSVTASGIVISFLLFLLVQSLLNRILISQKLKQANMTKDRFFSIIAHDLKSPFNALLGFSDILAKKHNEFDTIRRDKMIKTINNSAKNTYALVENLLNWSRSQLNNVSFVLETISTKAIIDEVLVNIQAQAEKKQIKIINHSNPDETIYADKNMIATVIRNLISNAIKYSHTNHTIIISCKKDEINKLTEISVADTGVGIEKDRINDLFKIDKNSSTHGTENESGTGLGLLLCKEFVEKHDGKIWVESEVEKGSVFKFTIPYN